MLKAKSAGKLQLAGSYTSTGGRYKRADHPTGPAFGILKLLLGCLGGGLAIEVLRTFSRETASQSRYSAT